MGFVLVLSGAEAGLARDLEAALRRGGVDACAPVHREIRSSRAGIWRSLAPQASVIVAIWTQSDSADKLFLEVLEQAAAANKLLAASADGTSIPARLTPVACTVEALSQAAARHVAATHRQVVAREYGALRKACANGGGKAWRAFLHAHPDGLFQAVAHAQLDMSSAPGYRPNPAQFADAATPWRTQPKRVAWGVAGLASALGALAIAAYFMQPFAATRHAASAPPAAPVLAPPSPTESVSVAPPSLAAAPIPANIPAPSPPADTRLARLGLPEPIVGPRTLDVAPQQSARTTPAALGTANLVLLPRPTTSTQIEPGLRAVVDQARRRQNYARDRAARSTSARTLAGAERSGRYHGDWANGGPSGLGAANWSDGARYEGSWRGARPDGMGVLSLANGIRYEGEFNNGSPTGRGVFWDDDGQQITGQALFSALVAARSAGPAPLSDTGSARSAPEN